MNAQRIFPLRRLLMLLVLAGFTSLPAAAQPSKKLVRFSLRNNSWQFRKFTIITYEPGQIGNSATAVTLAPGMRRRMALPVGTRVYSATPKQVAFVMSGESLTGEPLLTVSKRDGGLVIPLVD